MWGRHWNLLKVAGRVGGQARVPAKDMFRPFVCFQIVVGSLLPPVKSRPLSLPHFSSPTPVSVFPTAQPSLTQQQVPTIL